MGTHRAEHRYRRALWIGLAAVAVLLVVFGIWRVMGRDQAGEPEATPAAQQSPTSPSATRTPTQSAGSNSRSAHKDKPKSPDLADVAEASPRHIGINGLVDSGFDLALEPDGDRLTAPSEDEVARWASRGLPGSPASDTVVIVGEVQADGGGAFGLLYQTRKGRAVEITTDEGTLTYTIRTVKQQDAGKVLTDRSVTAQKPGRLVLVGNRYDASGNPEAKDVVVVAQLSDAS